MGLQSAPRESSSVTLFPDGNLADTRSRSSPAATGGGDVAARRMITVVACPQCAARFASSSDIEREWMQKHMERSHGPGRIARVRHDQLFQLERQEARRAS